MESCNIFFHFSHSFKSKIPSKHMKNEFNTFQCAAKLAFLCGLENAENFTPYNFVLVLILWSFSFSGCLCCIVCLRLWMASRQTIWITWLKKSRLVFIEIKNGRVSMSISDGSSNRARRLNLAISSFEVSSSRSRISNWKNTHKRSHKITRLESIWI